ncbi:amidohydrolase [Phreatobacter sp. AB_2022a]|uniref:amidohydrolase n=1 Tax=Phreatobacter sp. AB_2022a TaxID=3003134 RepID=UPI0022876A49|nr:amidohydrolase [Phreatobacter sp. AB_2022a]MCZ0732911.1 amidohydrolase [Phreatobacter sp. AB_2022a]
MPILPKADVVLRGGRVFVAYGEPMAEAVALWSGKVLAVGSSSDMEPLIGPATRVVELNGRLATPGLFEAHAHLLPLGLAMAEIDARPHNARTLDDLLGLIRAEAARKKPGEWIMARGYDQFELDVKRHPHRTELDAAAPDNPVYLVRACGHLAVVNSMALKLAGVTRETPVPAGGAIEQVNGELTGLMAENGRAPVKAVLPDPTSEDLVAAIERGGRYMNSFGITSTMDAAVGMRSKYREIAAYRTAVRTGRQPLRVTQCILASPDGILDQCYADGLVTGAGDDMLRVGPVKIFTDGSAGGKTAAMSRVYAGEEETHGIFCLTDKEMEEATLDVHAKGYQLAVHAIGDAAIEQTLSSMEKALAKYPDADRRHRIEHCGFNTMDQMRRMRRAGIEPVPQPVFLYDFGDLYRSVMPDERPETSYPMKTWIELGFKPAASTDAPVCDANIYPNFYQMLTRKTSRGTVIGASERISIERAIQAYTEFGAYVNKCEDHRGTLRPGQAADVAVFSRDMTTATPEEILTGTRCDLTILGGACVHDATGEWRG